MNRRAFLTSAGALALAMTRPVRAAGRKPNIIFFLADDLGMGDLGC